MLVLLVVVLLLMLMLLMPAYQPACMHAFTWPTVFVPPHNTQQTAL